MTASSPLRLLRCFAMDVSTEQLFDQARSHNGFTNEPVPESTLRRLWDLTKWGPTSANSSPARIVFVVSPGAKEQLLACMSPGNVEKTRQAPVSAVIGMDMAFYEHLPKLFPHRPEMKNPYEANAKLAETVAFRNGTLQGAYFMLAARAVGLDVGGMSGFDNAKVDAEFFPDGRVKSNFLCNLGHGDSSKVLAKLPRLDFDEACTLI